MKSASYLSLFRHLPHLLEWVAMTLYLTLTTRGKKCRKKVFLVEFFSIVWLQIFFAPMCKTRYHHIIQLCTDPLLRFPSRLKKSWCQQAKKGNLRALSMQSTVCWAESSLPSQPHIGSVLCSKPPSYDRTDGFDYRTPQEISRPDQLLHPNYDWSQTTERERNDLYT